MEFQKYNSIENSYRQKTVDQIMKTVDPNVRWYATEKIHGANYSIWSNGKDVFPAKRSGFISPDENFYGQSYIFEKYANTVKQMAISFDKTVAVYGELYGGSGPDFPTVQSGVYYADDLRFSVFDIRLDGRPVGLAELSTIAYMAGLPLTPVLHQGLTLSEALQLDPVFDSTIAGIENNEAEGYVLSPERPYFLNCGSRVLLKLKNPKFSEKKNKPKKQKQAEALNGHQQMVLDNLNVYITENRLRNVLSKVGQVTNKDFGKLVGLFTQDALEEFEGDHGVSAKKLVEQVDGSHWKPVNKVFQKDIAELIRANFLNIIDGNF